MAALTLAGTVALIACGTSASRPCNRPEDGRLVRVGTISFVARSTTVFESGYRNDPSAVFADVTISGAADACAEGKQASSAVSTQDMSQLSIEINYAHVGTFCAQFGSTTCAWARILFRPAGTEPGRGPSTYYDGTGSVTLTAVDLEHVAGNYDLQFPTGDKLTGTFDAPVCNVGSCAAQP